MSELLILGGGFAGVWAAMSAAAERDRLGMTAPRIRLVSRDPYLTIRTRLYEGLDPSMRVPLGPLMREIGVELQIAEVAGIDVDRQQVHMDNRSCQSYTRMILATGSHLAPIPVPGAAEVCHTVDTFEAAAALERHLAALAPDTLRDRAAVVIGASFTGLELATELRKRLPARARIVLVERGTTPGADLGKALQGPIREALALADIDVRPASSAMRVTPTHVHLSDRIAIASHTVLLATGLAASKLTGDLGVPLSADGRVDVDINLRVNQLPSVFAAGDTSRAPIAPGHATLMSCQRAIPMGLAAGRNAVRDLVGLEPVRFEPDSYVTCLDLGPWGAVFTSGWERRSSAKVRRARRSKTASTGLGSTRRIPQLAAPRSSGACSVLLVARTWRIQQSDDETDLSQSSVRLVRPWRGSSRKKALSEETGLRRAGPSISYHG